MSIAAASGMLNYNNNYYYNYIHSVQTTRYIQVNVQYVIGNCCNLVLELHARIIGYGISAVECD